MIDPRVLLLPAWLGERFDLARAIAETGRWSWTDGYRLLECFEMSSVERGFVKTLLARRTNLWLFRCHQRLACGDFVIVDMSPPAPADRLARVLELKSGAPLALGGARLQLAGYRDALAEIAALTGVIDEHAAVELVYGDPALVLAHLGVESI